MQKIFFTILIFFFAQIVKSQEIDPLTNINKDSLINKGLYLYELSNNYEHNWDSCYMLTFEASQLFEKAESWKNYVTTIESLAALEYLNNNILGSLKWNETALAIATEKYDSLDPDFSKLYNNLAFDHSYLGNLNIAEKNYKKAIDFVHNYHPNKKGLYIYYNNLGVIYRKKGDYESSEKYIRTSINLMTQNKMDNRNLGITYYSLGNTYFVSSDFQNARISYLLSIEKLSSEKNTDRDLFNSKIKLLETYLELDSLEQFDQISKTIFRDLESIPEELQGSFFITIAKCYHKKDDLKMAMKYIDLSLSRLKIKSISDQKLHLGNTYFLKAKFENENGSTLKSILSIDSALYYFTNNSISFKNLDNIRFKVDAIKALAFKYDLVTNNRIVNNHANPHQVFTNILKLIVSLRKENLSLDSKLFLMKDYNLILEKAIEQFFTESSREKIFNLFESNKSITVLDQLDRNKDLVLSGIPKSQLSLELKLKSLISFYNRTIQDEEQKTKEGQSTKLLNWKKELIKVETDYNALLHSFEEKYPEYYQLKYSDFELSLEAFQKSLSKNELAIEYYVADSVIYSMAIDRDTVITTRIENKSHIEEIITQWLNGIRNPTQNTNSHQDIGSILIDPELLDSKSYERLIIIPDGFILNVPFEILQEEDGSYLMEDFNISYHYSATLRHMLSNQKNVEDDKRKNDFGGFCYSSDAENLASKRDCSQESSYDLLCSAKEVASISEIMDADTSSEFRTKKEFADQADNYRIIHLSTHACADPEDINLSKIYFEDDYMTSYEIQALDIDAELAVLSACETGTGLISKGEGVMSLAKSFFFAGCKSTLISLWPVDDCSTSEIMIGFYKHLKDGKHKDEALRLSKLDYLRTAHPERRSPYYWAGFVIVGNNAPLFSPGFSKLWLFGIGVLILLLITAWLYKSRLNGTKEIQTS